MNINLTFFLQLCNALVSIFFVRFFLIKPFLYRIERKKIIFNDFLQQKNHSVLRLKALKVITFQELKLFQENIKRSVLVDSPINHDVYSQLQPKKLTEKKFLKKNNENMPEVELLSAKILELIHDFK